MGVVYAAQTGTTWVAVKVLHVASREAIERFAAEATVMQRLEHPGIARVLATGEMDGHPYFVMELVDGKTLDRFKGSLRDKLELFALVCDAIHHAHEHGVVHRDLKPANIMTRRGGGVAILDFGVARIAETSGKTRAGDVLGTPLYMSPEQALGRVDEVDARTDVYALGVVLFELIAGVPPYDIRGLPLPAAVRTIVLQSPRALGIDPAIDGICASALAKSREHRFRSAAALGEAVRNYARSLTE
jgi:serine/threonine-protein kinase